MSSSRSKPPKNLSDRPTVVPPVPAAELAARPGARPTPRSRPAIRDAQATITNEDALEEARLASMQSMPTPLPVPVPTGLAVPEDRPSRVATGRPGPPTGAGIREEMRERLTLGDFAGALELAERLVGEAPGDDEAMRTARECRETLTELYEGRLGSLDRVPFVVVARDELRFLSLDHRAGFLLSHIDGVSPLDSILDVSGMPRLDALRILVELVQKRVVSLR